MAEKYQSGSLSASEAHFSASPENSIEYSRWSSVQRHITTFNAGDIVPIACQEVIPGETLDCDIDSVLRENTLSVPFMGELYVDVYAFFVPHRVVNKSFKQVFGENSAGAWALDPEVTLAPLYMPSQTSTPSGIQIPIGSVADYYGYPTQAPLDVRVLAQMHDLKFRGYIEIYNEYFRDQNYQAPIPYSKLNVYEGFLTKPSELSGILVGLAGGDSNVQIGSFPVVSNGAVGAGSILKEVYGEGSDREILSQSALLPAYHASFSALGKPLKANKLHDYFTSVLPSPQKGQSVTFLFPSNSVYVPVNPLGSQLNSLFPDGGFKLMFGQGNNVIPSGNLQLDDLGHVVSSNVDSIPSYTNLVTNTNLQALIDAGALGQIDVAALRTAIATQHVFEQMARGGSRYREIVSSFFGVDVDDPFSDIPQKLGHIRRTLANYQVAQTSPSSEGSTPQGNLAAYSYTPFDGRLFHARFLEHGYVHILAVVRHKNVYGSLLTRDNFRLGMLDFYNPLLANISEQPVYARELSPFFTSNADISSQVFGYQEAWAEHRYDPDMVSSTMRPGLGASSLSQWTLSELFTNPIGNPSPNDLIADGSWLQSNSQEVVDNTLAITSAAADQFRALFAFTWDKTMPMPLYSVPGLDTI